jgi:hypothetical protein
LSYLIKPLVLKKNIRSIAVVIDELLILQINIKLPMKFIIFLILTLICISSYGQIKLIKLDNSSLPKSLKYAGHIVNAVNWKDSLGLNYVITTETGKIQSKNVDEEGNIDAALYVYHYVVEGENIKLLWKVYDFNNDCPVDLDLYFIDKTFLVTDLDKNGIAEVWIMYKNSCHGDVSPVPTKIIMYEGNKKYALRGESKVKVSATEFMGGNFTLDDNFKNGNIAFRQYAEKLWTQNKLEKWHR